MKENTENEKRELSMWIQDVNNWYHTGSYHPCTFPGGWYGWTCCNKPFYESKGCEMMPLNGSNFSCIIV